MKGFYDKILVDAANKLTKKFGGRVEDTTIDVQDQTETGLADVHSLEITPELRKTALEQGFSLFQKEGEIKGQTTITDSERIITLFEGADKSTFQHESAHVFLDVMKKDAARLSALTEKSDQQKNYQKLMDDTLTWLGVKSFDDIEVKHHEKFAEHFEKYLQEGVAPTRSLQKVFNYFRRFLSQIYRLVNKQKVDSEIRSIFDRILASEQEIESQLGPAFAEGLESGMTPEVAARYARAKQRAREYAEKELQTKLMEYIVRSNSKMHKNLLKEKKERIRAELLASRTYQIKEALKAGEKDGVPFSISRETTEAQYGKDVARTVKSVTKKGGVYSPEEIAEAYGYLDGISMLRDVANAPRLETAVNTLAEQEIQRERPDLYQTPKMTEEAKAAVHNEDYAEVLRLEAEHISNNAKGLQSESIKRLMRRMPSSQAMKLEARRRIANESLSDVASQKFLRGIELAEQKARKNSSNAFVKGDFLKAFEWKQKEALNNALYRAAVDAQEYQAAMKRRFARANKQDDDLRAARDMNLVNAARALLAKYRLGRGKGTPEQYLKNIRTYDPDAYEVMERKLESIDVKDPLNLSYGEFDEITDVFNALWSLARAEKSVLVDGKRIDKEQIAEELDKALEGFSDYENKRLKGNLSAVERFVDGAHKYSAWLKRVEHVISLLDRGSIQGPFRKYLYTPVSEAITQFRKRKAEKKKELLEIFKKRGAELVQGGKIAATEIDFTFDNKAHLLSALLHTGNRSNLSKLLIGRGWGTVSEEGILDTTRWDQLIDRMHKEGVLTKADWDTVQELWDLFESIKAEAQKAHKQVYGFYFNEITAEEFETPFGKYRGGYAPAKIDPEAYFSQAKNVEKELMGEAQNSFMFPSTGKGFTISRVDNFAAPLMLDLGMVGAHLDSVLRFSHIQPAVTDVAKLITRGAIKNRLDQYDPTLVQEVLTPWLQRAATQKVMTPGTSFAGRGLDQVFSAVRMRAAFNVMTLNLSNALQQFTGLLLTRTSVDGKFIRDAAFNYVTSRKTVNEFITSRSEWMKQRLDNQMYEVEKETRKILLDSNAYDRVKDLAESKAYWLQQTFQNVVDQITWTAAYNQALEKGLDGKDAVREADSTVRQTQGSFAPEDIARIEAQNALVRMFTMFMSYFNNQLNLLGTKTGQILMKRMNVPFELASLYMFGLVLPGVLSLVISKVLSGRIDEDDDEEYLDDLMKLTFMGTTQNLLAMAPILGPVATSILNGFDDNPVNDRMTFSPVISQFQQAAKAPGGIYKDLEKGRVSKSTISDSLTLLGLMLGLPVSVIGRPLRYMHDVESGKVRPESDLDYVRGLVTGQSGAPK